MNKDEKKVHGLTTIQQAYLDANAKLGGLLNAAVDAIIIIDDKGTIELFNTAAESIFGYRAVEVVGQNVKMLMPDPYRREHDSYISNYNQTRKPNVIGKGREVTACRKSGETFPISLAVGEVKGSSHPQFVGFIRDISEKVRAEAEIKDARERLSHVSRLNTMGEMAAGIAHEINQPLTAIAAYAQACQKMLEMDPQLTDAKQAEKLRGALEKIASQSHRASEVIQRLRAFVKKRVAQKETVDINTLIEETIELAKVDTRILDHQITLALANHPAPLVLADPIQIQQVLLNLIRNAIDAMEDSPGAIINISSQWLDEDTLNISVADSGSGISEENQETLFHPFMTTKDSGMGMGLPICQSIIQAHGGQLSFTPNAPRGSVFSFTLPSTEPGTPASGD